MADKAVDELDELMMANEAVDELVELVVASKAIVPDEAEGPGLIWPLCSMRPFVADAANKANTADAVDNPFICCLTTASLSSFTPSQNILQSLQK